jgi:hypothetical protein
MTMMTGPLDDSHVGFIIVVSKVRLERTITL